MAKAEVAAGVAVIGLACRFPGARNVDEFWHNLRTGKESVSFFEDPELEASGVDAKALNNPNYVKAAAVLPGSIEDFDADFFGISAQEATLMDPQHRILLECAWEALESGGCVPHRFDGAIGVFVGSRISEYLLFNQPAPDLAGLEPGSGVTNLQRLICNDKDYLATRISFKLNLKGPSINVQTACSTSLVAVHVACESLLGGECDLALAGGVSVRVPQKAGYFYSEGMILSPDGHTRPFDADAGGTIFSSGAGIVALKRLQDALDQGDRILAVIKGTAVNNDGGESKAGYTAPSLDGQADVVDQALGAAGVEPESISYLETHGTATALGDLIELSALKRVFAGSATGRIAIGSVKSNIGHTVQAAGVAGLIKTVLMLHNQTLVPSLNFRTPNRQLDLDQSPFSVNTTTRAWATSDRAPRRAGVSSFGMGGTNAHLVLEEAPEVEEIREHPGQPDLLTLSARSDAALRDLAESYAGFLAQGPHASLADICFTANTGRTHFGHRLALAANSTAALAQKLAGFQAGTETPGVTHGLVQERSSQPKIAFLFSGQGSQHVDMGRQLYQTQPLFRAILDQCNVILGGDLLPVLYPAQDQASTLDETAWTQPALFAIEYALAQLWRSWGVEPSAVLGHSVGEYVAACIAGVFPMEEGLRLVAERARLMQALPQTGEMAVLFCDASQVISAQAGYVGQVCIAAENGPKNTAISGHGEAVQAVRRELAGQGIGGKQLNVSHAFHSILMDPMLESLVEYAGHIPHALPAITLVSSLTGKPVTRVDAAYWGHHAREKVKFWSGLRSLQELGCEVYLEIGPDSTLSGMGRRCLPEGSGVWLQSLRKGREDWQQLLESLSQLYVLGCDLRFGSGEKRRRVELPTVAWQRRRYWMERSARKKLPEPSIPGRRLLSPALREIVFESHLCLRHLPFLDRPRLHIGAYQEMLAGAVREGLESESYLLKNVTVVRPLHLLEEDARTVQIILSQADTVQSSFRIFSHEGGWSEHAHGEVELLADDVRPERIARVKIQERCREQWSDAEFQAALQSHQIQLTPLDRWVEQVWRRNGEALGRMRRPEGPLDTVLPFHPGLTHACVHLLYATLEIAEGPQVEAYLMSGFESCRVYRHRYQGLWGHAVTRPGHGPDLVGDLCLFDETGQVVVAMKGTRLKALGGVSHGRDRNGSPGPFQATLDLVKCAPQEARPGPLSEYLRAQLSRLLGVPEARLEGRRSLLQMGLDSLMAIDLRNRIEVDLKVHIPMVAFLTGPSLDEIAALVEQRMFAGAGQATVGRNGSQEWETGTIE
ncbi:acyltransferase domain-containing protein [bacterium]|nr:acyltransferase domain-containing protein [bacterium]